MKIFILVTLHLLSAQIFAQRTSISYELNGKHTNQEIRDAIEISKNPFAQFIGEWTLKNDTWVQNWGGENDTLKIHQHHTISCQINTENSLLSIIDGPEPNGHILWSFNPNTKEVNHLSSFGAVRIGVGKGEFYGQNNLRLKISFEGEAPGTYRIYTYEWISDSEYALHSKQFDEKGNPTGLFYEGNFIRIDKNESLLAEIENILDILDNNEIPKEEQIAVYAETIVHMAPNHEVISNKDDLLLYLNQQKSYGHSDMEHKIVAFSQHDDIVVMRGRVEGVFYPINGDAGVSFQTKNLFIFERINGQLKISKVIYNMSPND
ncbi:MAG: hypothetical protein AAF806_03410 [Bacteroidota bacterium]